MPRQVSGDLTPCIVAFVPRVRARALARSAIPRRHGRVLAVRTADEFATTFRQKLIDGAVVDVGTPGDEPWRAAALAREFPKIPFFAVLAVRATEAPALARCVELEFADVLVEGVDEPAAREMVAPQLFSARFARALHVPPAALELTSALQRATWARVVALAGRPVQTSVLARALGMTREHLSRSFATGGAPNLKRVIDLVRLLAAAELAKNPGYDVRDVARILGFASPSHLSATTQRVAGTRPASLSRLRTTDLVDRFVRGRGRSRG